MKRLILFAFAALSTAACADEAYKGYTRFRDNDPFVFCTYGQRNPTRCWWPVDPISATYFSDPTCDPPDTYGRPWTTDDWESLYDYQQICPHALKKGGWKGPGTGEQVPTIH